MNSSSIQKQIESLEQDLREEISSNTYAANAGGWPSTATENGLRRKITDLKITLRAFKSMEGL